MLIKCENCSVVYEVPEERLTLEHPHFFKCSACGSVFAVSVEEEKPSLEEKTLPVETLPVEENLPIPPVEQSDVVPMHLSDIFNPVENSVENPVETEEIEEQADSEKKEEPKKEKKEQEVNLFEPLDDAEEFSPVTSESSQNKHFLSFIISFIVAFAAVILVFYVGRYFFIRKVPATEKIYQAVGVKTDVLGEGLAFQETLFDIQRNNQNYELVIKSQIVNTTDKTKHIPDVVVRLLDENDKVIQSGRIYLSNTAVKAGQMQPIETHLKELAEGAKRVEITFERKGNW